MKHLLQVPLCALAILLMMVPVAAGQTIPEDDDRPDDTPEGDRRARLIEERMEKLEYQVAPEEPGFFEGLVRTIEGHELGAEGGTSVGFYGFKPVVGGLRSGSGIFTGGLRYEPVSFDTGPHLFALDARYSLRGYWGVASELGYKPVDPVTLYGFGQYWHMPDEDFFGIGPDTPGDVSSGGLVDYRHDQGIAGGLAAVTVLPDVSVGGIGAYEWNRVSGLDVGEVDTGLEGFQDVPAYDEGTGVTTELDYTLLGGFIEYDGRDAPRDDPITERWAPLRLRPGEMSFLAKRGIFLGAQALHYLPSGEGAPPAAGAESYEFTRLNMEAEEYIPIRNGFQVLALRQFASFSLPRGDAEVPYYLMRTIGGSHTIRGYDTFRFRDRHLAVLTAEYRWRVWLMLDLALFTDMGYAFGAFDQFGDIGYSELETSYGIGLRFKSENRMFVRIDFAYSEEGPSIYLRLL